MIQEGNPVTQAPSSGRSCPIGRRIGPKRTDAPILRRLTATPAGRALRCSLDVQAMLTQEPGSEILCRISACGRGLLLFVMQHWKHKSKSRNADYILIAATGGDTTTLSPKGCQTLEPYEPFEPSRRRRVRRGWPPSLLNPYFTELSTLSFLYLIEK